MRVDLPVIRGKIYWSNVNSALGKTANNLLAAKCAQVKEIGEIRRFKSERFHRLLCINSTLKLLSLLPEMRLPGEVCVIDYAGVCAPELQSLPKYCRAVKIVTYREEKYASLKHSAMEEFGCAIICTDDISRAFDSPVIIMPEGSAKAVAFSRRSFIFSPFSDNIYSSNVFTMNSVSLAEKYLHLLPAGIEVSDFAAALYEQSDVSELGHSICSTFKCNNKLLSYKDIISILDY